MAYQKVTVVAPCVPRSSTLKATRIRLQELTSDVEQGRSSKMIFIVVGLSSDDLARRPRASLKSLLHGSCGHHARINTEYMNIPQIKFRCEIQLIDGEDVFSYY